MFRIIIPPDTRNTQCIHVIFLKNFEIRRQISRLFGPEIFLHIKYMFFGDLAESIQ